MERLEFHISYKCTNNCRFCSEQDQLDKFAGQFVFKESICQKLRYFSQEGFNHITFTGGEPTFHPHFIEILQFAKKAGYKTYVTTNGGLFSLKRFTRKALPYLDEICFSLHGHNAKLHNFHTRNKESFVRLIRALKNIEEEDADSFGFVNMVITRYNFDFVHNAIDFISRYKKIRQILISNFAPEGNGLHNFRELVVPLNRIKKRVGDIVSLAQNRSMAVKFFGVPLCLLNGYQDYSNDAYWSPRATIERWKVNKRIFLKKTLSYKPVRGRIKTLKCRQCLKRDICGGVFRRYNQEFGDHELTPFVSQAK